MKCWMVCFVVLGLLVGACDGEPAAGEGGAAGGGEVVEGERGDGEKEGGVFKSIGDGLVRKALRSQGMEDGLQEMMDQRFEAANFGEEGPAVGPVARRSGKGGADVHAGDLGDKPESGGGFGEKVTSAKGFFERKYIDLGRQIHKVRVMGAAHEAEIEIVGGKVGEVVFLIDVRGWVIARLVLREAVETATVSVKLEENAGLELGDRVWVFEVDGAEVVADLSLYYRDTPVENWHGDGGHEEIVRRRDVVVKRVDGAGGLEVLETRVDPQSDQIVARVSLGDGTKRFVVGYRRP